LVFQFQSFLNKTLLQNVETPARQEEKTRLTEIPQSKVPECAQQNMIFLPESRKRIITHY
jgi:hypothetical protein